MAGPPMSIVSSSLTRKATGRFWGSAIGTDGGQAPEHRAVQVLPFGVGEDHGRHTSSRGRADSGLRGHRVEAGGRGETGGHGGAGRLAQRAHRAILLDVGAGVLDGAVVPHDEVVVAPLVLPDVAGRLDVGEQLREQLLALVVAQVEDPARDHRADVEHRAPRPRVDVAHRGRDRALLTDGLEEALPLRATVLHLVALLGDLALDPGPQVVGEGVPRVGDAGEAGGRHRRHDLLAPERQDLVGPGGVGGVGVEQQLAEGSGGTVDPVGDVEVALPLGVVRHDLGVGLALRRGAPRRGSSGSTG